MFLRSSLIMIAMPFLMRLLLSVWMNLRLFSLLKKSLISTRSFDVLAFQVSYLIKWLCLSSGDFTNIPDFHTAMNLVRQAQEEFVRIPADVRARFNNDPGRFMEFLMTLLTMMRLLSWVLSMFVPCSSIGYS